MKTFNLKRRPLTYFSISIAMLFWGFSFIWTNRVLLMGFPVFALVFFRMAIAGVVLLLCTVVFKKLEIPRKKDMVWFFLLALAEPFLYFIGEVFGMKLSGSPTLASIVIATIPVFSMLFAMIVYHEKLSWWNMTGIFLTVPGITIVVFENGFGKIEHPAGLAMLFLAVFSAVAYTLIVKKLSNLYNSITINTLQHVIGAFYFLPLFFFLDYPTVKTIPFTWELIRPLLLLAIFCSCLCYLLLINTVRELGVSRTSTFTSLIPAVTAIGAFLLGDEMLPSRKIVGITIVVLGLILSQYTKKM